MDDKTRSATLEDAVAICFVVRRNEAEKGLGVVTDAEISALARHLLTAQCSNPIFSSLVTNVVVHGDAESVVGGGLVQYDRVRRIADSADRAKRSSLLLREIGEATVVLAAIRADSMRELVSQGWSYGRIADTLEISKSMVQKILGRPGH